MRACPPEGRRKGTAAVEFALVLPLFLLLVVGAIDVGRIIMVQHTLVQAARAGCRMYSLQGELTKDDARTVIAKVMENASLDGYTVKLKPSTSAKIQHKAPVTVSVSIPYNQASWIKGWFHPGGRLTGTCIMPGDNGGGPR